MANHANAKSATEDVAISERDILFECPSCGKSLVVDQTAEGMIIDCPQCHINVIVPPRTAVMPVHRAEAPPPTPVKPIERPAEPAASPTVEVARLQEQLTVLATRLKETQTQWADATNRIATRINEINRELVGLARVEAAHKQILKEWNDLIGQLAAANEEIIKDLPVVPKK